jgi:hypothetical protein
MQRTRVPADRKKAPAACAADLKKYRAVSRVTLQPALPQLMLFLSVLAGAAAAASYVPKGPRFGWETLPVFIHPSNASVRRCAACAQPPLPVVCRPLAV